MINGTTRTPMGSNVMKRPPTVKGGSNRTSPNSKSTSGYNSVKGTKNKFGSFGGGNAALNQSSTSDL